MIRQELYTSYNLEPPAPGAKPAGGRPAERRSTRIRKRDGNACQRPLGE